jgi:hypothetical protein
MFYFTHSKSNGLTMTMALAPKQNRDDPNLLIGDRVFKLTEKGFEATLPEPWRKDGKYLSAEIAPVFEEGVYGIECTETYSKK